jgi:glycosyltransferase involved in cell wall biosynthesis
VSLTVLSVAYPFAPVGPDAVGGAEQVLTQLERALVKAGHRSIVIACEGSQAAGTLLTVPAYSGVLDDKKEIAWAHHRDVLAQALARYPVDIVHMHGIDYFAYLPAPGVPVLCTLHGPMTWYPWEALWPGRPDTWLHCVSESQHATVMNGMPVLAPIENGVPIDDLQGRHAKRDFALFLGRICPEKGVHLAIDAAKAADVPLLIAGEIFGYEAHRKYFTEEIEPRLDAKRRYLGPAGFARKRRLLNAARCLLVASPEAETSSLVTREAIACGTPVIAFPNGALPESVRDGRTGFLVDDVAGMARAIGRSREIDPETCRRFARDHFSIERMRARYVETYGAVIKSARRAVRSARVSGAA